MESMNRVLMACLVLTSIFLIIRDVACFEAMSVSIPEMDKMLAENERIASIEIVIRGGTIGSFTKVPDGWGICLQNELSGEARLKGNMILTIALLDQEYFQDFFIVEKGDNDFYIEGKLGTYTYLSHKQRIIVLKEKDFLLRPVGKR
jgi:hypothetical protein